MNCSSDLKIFANSWPSASNVKSFSQSLEQFFLTVGQNNFGNKILYFHKKTTICTFPDFSFIRHLELSLLKSLLVYSFEFSFFLFQVSSDIKKHPNDAELRDKLKYVCIGDINRMATQYKRGGGTVCFHNEFVWKAFRNLISSFEACPRLF